MKLGSRFKGGAVHPWDKKMCPVLTITGAIQFSAKGDPS